jgi:DNA replicative helicase MCM subunit Mcm2 (Cdc46/Mcm family)
MTAGNDKENKEKGIVYSSVMDNTINTSNTSNTSNTESCVLSVLCDKPIPTSIFGENTFEKILQILATEKDDFTYDKIAERLGKVSDNIRQAINRKKEFFDLKMPNGRICHTTLSQIAVREINARIIDFYQNLQKKEELKKQREMDKNDNNFLVNEFKKYLQIGKISYKGNIVKIDFMDLAENCDLRVSELIDEKPEEAINLMESAIEDKGLIKNVRIRIFNLPKDRTFNIEQLRSKHINELICLTGRVITLSDVRPQCVSANFECPSCGTTMSMLQLESKFKEPPRCSCGRRGGFKVISKEMVDTARLMLEDLQEKTDNPHSKRINCFLKEDLLSEENMRLYLPGNEVEIVGILKEVPVINKSTGGTSTRFELAFEVLSVRQAKEETTYDKLTEEDIEKIKEVAFKIDKEGFVEILDSFCPEVYGYDYIKKAEILQLASKPNKNGKKREKNKPNILLIGEPGVAKTALGEFAVDITNGARKSVGGSASAVGFTGAVVRDEYSGGWMLEPGAIVLAKDLFMLDELNNIQEEDRPRLQEALSENTITIDKATIHTKLSAPASIIATANPKDGLFNDDEDLTKQFSLTAPIINRFDLIFAVKDSVNEENDLKIAKKMNEREMNKIKCKYDKDFLKKFFIYIKEQENPIIDDETSDKISKIYSKLRKFRTKSLNINPRVHLAFLQLCKASARLRLSEKIEEKDIEVALELLNKSYFRTPTLKELNSKF